MPRNFCSLHGSKMRCNLGWSERGEVGGSGRQFAASAAACRAIAVEWSDASGSGAPRWAARTTVSDWNEMLNAGGLESLKRGRAVVRRGSMARSVAR